MNSTHLGHYIELQARDGHALRAFVIEPARPARAALVLLQEMDQRTPGEARRAQATTAHLPGVNMHIRTMARQYASEGYRVICPSTFGRGHSGQDRGYRFEDAGGRGLRIVKPLQALDSDAVMLDVEAALAWAQRTAPGGRVGLVGYCWGGLLAWRAASAAAGGETGPWPRLQAAVCFYPGGLTLGPDAERRARVPVQLHLPTDDSWMPVQASQAFARAQAAPHASVAPGAAAAAATPATAAGPLPEVHVYDAPYGFAHAGRRTHQPRAAALSHQKSLQFLASRLLGD